VRYIRKKDIIFCISNIKINKKDGWNLKMIIIVLIFSISFILLMPYASSLDVYPIRIINSTIPSSDVEFVYINVDNHFEYGKEVGKRWRPFIKAIFFDSSDINDFLENMKQSEIDEIENHLDICDPDFKSEIQGFRTTLDRIYPKTSINDTEAMYIIRRITNLNFKEKCTTTLSSNDATSNNENYTFKF
jgi:hypothetical protein